MISRWRIHFLVLLLFAIMVVVQLLPLSLNIGDSLNDTRDCLFNAWIITWGQQQLTSNPTELFHANIFYPHRNTLSFSEHLFPQVIASFPLYFLFHNPVLTYNFIFLLCFLLNAYAMYLLILYLTKNRIAGIACGIMFAFNSYQINQITHLQLLSSGLIPLAFLYLHKFLDKQSYKNSVLFSLFFTIQALACIYYGLFFLSILVIVIPVLVYLRIGYSQFSSLRKFILPALFSGVVLILFSLPYLSLIKTYKFETGLQKGADLLNYLAVIPDNILFGKLLSNLGKHEHYLFPGIIAFLFAFVYLIRKHPFFNVMPRISTWFFAIWVTVFSIIILISLLSGGFTLDLKLFSISSHKLVKQVLYIFVIAVIYVVCSLIIYLRKLKNEADDEKKIPVLYICLLNWAFLLSLGGAFGFLGEYTSEVPFPFKFLYSYVPGFQGIRVPARYAIFVIFSVVVLSGYGLSYVLQKIKVKQVKILMAVVLILVLNIEYFSIPHQLKSVPTKENIPPVYQWLDSQPGEFAIIELPFNEHPADEAMYMYYSLYHKKNIVNGWSGFIPPAYSYIRSVFRSFPSQNCIEILRASNVNYIVFHTKTSPENQSNEVVMRLEDQFRNDLELVEMSKSFENDLVYKVLPKKIKRVQKEHQTGMEISPQKWKVSSNRNEDLLPLLKDSNLDSIWSTSGRKRTGDYLLLEFPENLDVNQVSLYLGKYVQHYAINLRLEISQDGQEWKKVNRFYSAADFTLNLIDNPLEPVQNIHFGGNSQKYLKITQMGDDREFPWSVAEIKVYSRPVIQ